MASVLAGDDLPASGSFREAWTTPPDVFSRKREDDDENELRWAAIERLPTLDRMKKGVVTQVVEDGNVVKREVVDVTRLGLNDRRQLLESVLKVVEEDNEKFLRRVRDRTDRVGIDIPKIEVRYENLSVEGDVHVGSRALPTLLNAVFNVLENVLGFIRLVPSKKKKIQILENVSGIVKPSRMTLLLGLPGAGKTTLLLALAGKLDKDLREILFPAFVTSLLISGRDIVPERTCAYIGQHDLHQGEMTVRETFDFSGRCLGVGTRYELLMELLRRERAAGIKPDPELDAFMKATAVSGQKTSLVTDYVLKILGLDICADIMVGNEMVRGISGGQKKRVTTGEMLVGTAKVLLMDEISTGLDSSTTYQICKFMRQMVHILDVTMVVSLLQPAPETYELFDDIILLSEGQIIYQGPRENILDFFEYMGFRCPERKGVVDFLQEVTSKKDQEQYWCKREEPYRYISVPEFVLGFSSFHIGQKLGSDISVPYDKSYMNPAALVTEKYGISNWELFRACFSREWLLMKRHSFIYIFKTTQITIMAIIAFTVFLRTKMEVGTVQGGQKFYGALFFSLLNVMFNGTAELALTVLRLPIFFKQRDFMFYPAWAFALPIWILRIPLSLLESVIWIVLTYYTIGFAPSASRFFRQFLALFGIHQMALGLFRFIAAVGRTMVVANILGIFTMVLVFVLGGFIIAKDDIHPWLIWGYYISPMMYGQNAIVMNEFLDKRWSAPNPDPRIKAATVGEVLLKSRGFFTDDYLFWEMKKEGIEESRLQLLCDVSGAFRPGVLTALVGVSGAGKTTLMDVLAGRKSGGYIEGSVSISGYPKNQATFARVSGYCEQNDIHSPHVTVYESLVYSAWLRLSTDIDAKTRKMFVEEIMELVELRPLRNALVGLPGVDGLSTEQRKRLTIAVELVANPSIIFMDEPTSGLDARAAAIVMRTVRNTVDTGRTVVCTIHQPSIDIFESFDELLLMKRGAQVIYAGPLGHRSHKLVEYFEAIPGVPKIKDGLNPATWMLEISTPAMESQLNVDFAQTYADSPLHQRNQELIKELGTPTTGSKDLYFPTKYSRSFFTQCRACFWKQYWSYWRNTQYNAIRLLLTIVIGVLFGLIFWNKGQKISKQQDLLNLLGAMYSAALFLGATNTNAVQAVVAVERTVFYREKAAGMYSALPYAIGQVFIEIIYVAIQTTIYVLLLYSMIGFEWKAEKFFPFLFFIYLCLLIFTLYGMMTVALTPGQQIAAIVMSFFLTFWNLFSGFLLPRMQIPIWWRWYYWGSPVAWTIYGLITSQLGDKDSIVEVPGVGDVPLKALLKNYFGYEYDFLPYVALALTGFFLVFLFIFAYGIKFLNFQRR